MWALGLRYRRMRSSMAVAIERGRTPEIDYLNGEIVRAGRQAGVPTPLNETVVALMRRVEDERRFLTPREVEGSLAKASLPGPVRRALGWRGSAET